jgi:hypothetical protein
LVAGQLQVEFGIVAQQQAADSWVARQLEAEHGIVAEKYYVGGQLEKD